MKNYVYNKEAVFIGKVDEIKEYLRYLSLHYATIEEFIHAKNKKLEKKND